MSGPGRRQWRPTGEKTENLGFVELDSGAVHGTFQRPSTGRRITMTAVPVVADEAGAPREQGDAIGSPGSYEVAFVLAIPGSDAYVAALDLSEFAESGSSLLQLPPRAHQVRIVVHRGASGTQEFTISKNASGLLSKIVLSVKADTFVDAEQEAHDLVAPMLSWWSFRYNVAIHLKGWIVRETATGALRVDLGVLGRPAITDDNRYFSRPEYRFVLSTYREGMNTNNVFYQALCFWKVIEGTLRLRGVRRRNEGAAFSEPLNEVIPAGDALEALEFHDRESLRPYTGRTFGYVREKLRPVVRNAIAHLDPTGQEDSLVADEFADFSRCEDAAAVLRHIGRLMLENELRSDPEVEPLLHQGS